MSYKLFSQHNGQEDQHISTSDNIHDFKHQASSIKKGYVLNDENGVVGIVRKGVLYVEHQIQ